MVEEVLVFTDLLKDVVRRGEIVKLENLTINLTLDIIGRVTM